MSVLALLLAAAAFACLAMAMERHHRDVAGHAPPTPRRRLLQVLGVLGPVLPLAWRINPASRIARALVDAALAPPPGEHVVASSALAG